jgi:uncharacterized membrane protein
VLPEGNILRIVFGLPFLLFLPGYSLVSALWVRRSVFDWFERIAWSLGVSIVIVPLVGLGLNYSPWGINLVSVVISLYCLILLLVMVASIRRLRLSPGERFIVNMDSFFDSMKTMSYTDKITVIIVGIGIIIGLGLVIDIATNPYKEPYSELFLLDGNGTIEDYPKNLEINEDASIIIGVVCHENEFTYYNATVSLVPSSGANITLVKYSFSLDDGEEWMQVLNFSVSDTGKFKLLVEIFIGEDTSPYLSNHIWIDVTN